MARRQHNLDPPLRRLLRKALTLQLPPRMPTLFGSLLQLWVVEGGQQLLRVPVRQADERGAVDCHKTGEEHVTWVVRLRMAACAAAGCQQSTSCLPSRACRSVELTKLVTRGS